MASQTLETTLGPIQLGDKLGKGAFGTVYRALMIDNGHTVAVKEMPRASDSSTTELKLLQSLNHPNIVQLFGVHEEGPSVFLVLEFVENGSLYTSLKRFGPLPDRLVGVYLANGLLDGIAYLHDQGVVHCDIKVKNEFNK